MKTKTIFNFLAFAMLMAAMVLTTACSGSDDIAVNKPETTEPTEPVAKKGYPLQVTVNVTREGDDATRATYNDNGDGTGSLSFSTGDQLFVRGYDDKDGGAGKFAGTLTWQSGGTFSGTITTENAYSGTADALLTAATESSALLLPAGYTAYNYITLHEDSYNSYVGYTSSNTYATTKKLAVEQFSDERATSYSNGFALHPQNCILNFTIYNLTANATNVAISFTGINAVNISKTVTADADGKATFAIGVEKNTNLNDYSLTVGGNAITLGSHALVAGRIYNVTRYANTISGKFTVNASGDKVYFSKSNLQATTSNNGTTWTWHFADRQNARVGNGTANTKINGNGTVSNDGNGKNVDLFGWSTSATHLGISNNPNNSAYSGAFVDWGSAKEVTDCIGTGWRTLTSDEWRYVTATRSGNRFALASIDGTRGGIILLPDDWNTTYYTLNNINNANVAFTVNTITAADWTSKLEAHGAVFLPVTGQRNSGTTINGADEQLHYWSATATSGTTTSANHLRWMPNTTTPEANRGLAPDTGAGRCNGFAVRLVRDVE